MTVTVEVRRIVRQRANFACEYCGVTEVDTGGELTVDHYQPRTHDGTDDLENLIYCCPRCNQYKGDYWPLAPSDPSLWHPRREPIEPHLLLLADGTLYPISATGRLTLELLHLNRSPLVAYRLQKLRRSEEMRLMERYDTLVRLLGQLYLEQSALLTEHRMLLEEQRRVIDALIRRQS